MDEKTLEDIIGKYVHVVVGILESLTLHSKTVRTCFVRPYNTDPKKVPPSVKYFLHPQHSVVIKGFIRYELWCIEMYSNSTSISSILLLRDHCTDVLFDSGGGFDLTVTSTILESLMQVCTGVHCHLCINAGTYVVFH